ncbi:hypothetical protein ACFZDP_11195 [Streptomyces mirabilis]|uniref:hypothetical protein n=1 Tax=Streptomyces mirabilis TaxID=68239 RepID=UPI0036E1F507
MVGATPPQIRGERLCGAVNAVDPPSLPARGQERPTTASRRTAHVEDEQPIHSWATYIGKTEQYTEYYGLRLDRQRRLPGGVNGGEVPFREYHDLRADPYPLTTCAPTRTGSPTGSTGRVRNRSAASAYRSRPDG